MILRFDFRKKKKPLKPLILTVFLVLILSLLVTQKEELIKFSKSFNISKVSKTVATKDIKGTKIQKARDINLTAEKPQFAEKKLVLCGIFQLEDQRYAFLKSSDGARFILREGEYAGSFKVESVYIDSVILVWNNGKREVIQW